MANLLEVSAKPTYLSQSANPTVEPEHQGFSLENNNSPLIASVLREKQHMYHGVATTGLDEGLVLMEAVRP